jgi:glutathione S-transferase
MITALEAGVPLDLVRVDLRSHRTQDGADYHAVNPKGYVPTLELDDGTRLTEGAVIDQYIADRNPEAGLLPEAGTVPRYRVLEWLNFIASEIHKSFSPLFGSSPDEVKRVFRDKIAKRFDLIDGELASRPFLTGDRFTVADAYLFNVLTWVRPPAWDLARWPALQAFFALVKERPAVQAALAAERGGDLRNSALARDPPRP